MNFNNEKGYTGVDISIAIVIIFIFVSVISVIMYNFNSGSREVELKSEATSIAIDEIENIKMQDFNDVVDTDEQEIKQGFYRNIQVTDYAQGTDKVEGLVKNVKVTISYKYKNKEQKVELSTIVSKEN